MRRLFSITFLAASAAVAQTAGQEPLAYPYNAANLKHDSYKFKWPINKVAIIGAGVGGLISYRELSQAGFDVHVYERDHSPGGNWHYTDEIPVDAAIPNAPIAVGDYAPSLPPKGAKLPYAEEYHNEEVDKDRRRAHRGPKPLWASLRSNAPSPIQQVREFPWPKGTEWELPQRKLQRYLRAFASWHGINNNDDNPDVSYNTRVETIEKKHLDGNEAGWTLTLKELVRTQANTTRATWYKKDFDAVVVATGRYNAPNIPDIEGLEAWGKRFPNHLSHSRQYRHPAKFAGKTILIVGAATSGGEISREVIQLSTKVYQSVRPDWSKVPHFTLRDFLRRLPANVSLVPEIKSFHAPGASIKDSKIELLNGTIITGIDYIIFGTGYRYTYPFLPQYHNPSLGLNDTLPRVKGVTQPIVTDGTHLRSLYLDAFYIDDPTLAFINANFGMQSFTYAEFLSLAAAKIWSGKADFPTTAELWRLYDETVAKREGYGRHFQFLGVDRTRDTLRLFQGWLNNAAVKYGGRQIDGLPSVIGEISRIWSAARFGNANLFGNTSHPNNFASLGLSALDDVTSVPDGSEAWVQDAVYNDYW